jgi:hypothetical protein
MKTIFGGGSAARASGTSDAASIWRLVRGIQVLCSRNEPRVPITSSGELRRATLRTDLPARISPCDGKLEFRVAGHIATRLGAGVSGSWPRWWRRRYDHSAARNGSGTAGTRLFWRIVRWAQKNDEGTAEWPLRVNTKLPVPLNLKQRQVPAFRALRGAAARLGRAAVPSDRFSATGAGGPARAVAA